jgi:septum formation protein
MLLLASASPARRRLLEQAAIPHRVEVSGVEEEAIQDADPARLASRLAQAKATAVADRLRQRTRGGKEEGDGEPIRAILGCDSLLVLQGEVFGKPANATEAIARWQRMAGAWGELLTGHCLLPWPEQASPARLCTVATRVRFAPLSAAEIAAYVATGEPLQCAGGFALEGRGGLMVEEIQGCFSNVIGLSLPLLRRWLLKN